MLHSFKIYPAIGLLCLSWGVCAETHDETNTCIYKGEEYSSGAIIEMAGEKRECRDGRLETARYYRKQRDGALDGVSVVPREGDDKMYAWRQLSN